MTTTKPSTLTLSRVFDAPVELVWNAWTDPKQIAKWWGPKNFTTPFVKLDFRVGGKYLYCMRSPEGQDFWSTGMYKEIIPLKKIVASDSFSDEKGNVVPASHYGMAADYPLELEVTFLFENQNGKTKFTLHHVGIPGAEVSDLTSVGWNEMLYKLADTLK